METITVAAFKPAVTAALQRMPRHQSPAGLKRRIELPIAPVRASLTTANVATSPSRAKEASRWAEAAPGYFRDRTATAFIFKRREGTNATPVPFYGAGGSEM